MTKETQSDVHELIECEELCINCNNMGTLKSIIMDIPHFQRVAVTSFFCKTCSYSTRSVQAFTDFKPKGIRCTLTANSPTDLMRQLVRSEFCKMTFSDVELEVPPEKNRTLLSTCEGLISDFVRDLNLMQPQRRLETPHVAEKIDDIVDYLDKCLETGNFKLVLDDPSGNSYIEILEGSDEGDRLVMENYTRTQEQDLFLGLEQEETIVEEKQEETIVEEKQDSSTEEEDGCEDYFKMYKMPETCVSCRADCEFKFQKIDVPHFSSVVIMTTVCWRCGYRNCQVKSAEPFQTYGVNCELLINSTFDLMREVILTDSSQVTIPEMDFESTSGVGLDSTFTTVEGLLMGLKDMVARSCIFTSGDSAPEQYRDRCRNIINRFDQICNEQYGDGVTIFLDDLAGNCRIQMGDEPDNNLKMTKYERTREQNEELGMYEEENKS